MPQGRQPGEKPLLSLICHIRVRRHGQRTLKGPGPAEPRAAKLFSNFALS